MADLPTVRAAIANALPTYTMSGVCECGRDVGRDPVILREHSATHILVALSDPAGVDELLAQASEEALWKAWTEKVRERLLQRTRNVVYMEPDGVPPNLEDRF